MNEPDYGIDAPGVVMALAAGGAVSAGIAFFAPQLKGLAITSIVLLAEAGWMVWGSRVGKLQQREKLLDAWPFKGDEQVLDVGCGRGLLLIGAAKRLSKDGHATGIDIWQASDLSANREGGVLENARLEGVEGRITVRTADMRELPFPDASFDVIVSSMAVHNVRGMSERMRALAEMARVLRPGGRVILQDFRHTRRYAAEFRRLGLVNITRRPLQWRIFPPAAIVMADRAT